MTELEGLSVDAEDRDAVQPYWKYRLDLATAGWVFAGLTLLAGPVAFIATCIVANRLLAARRVWTGMLVMLLSMTILTAQGIYYLIQVQEVLDSF